MLTDELDFDLPPELIAQEPPAQPQRLTAAALPPPRSYDRAPDVLGPSELLRPGDLLVFNDARVIPARFTLHKSTGGRVEGLFLQEVVVGRWNVLLKNPGPIQHLPLHFAEAPPVSARILEDRGEGNIKSKLIPLCLPKIC